MHRLARRVPQKVVYASLVAMRPSLLMHRRGRLLLAVVVGGRKKVSRTLKWEKVGRRRLYHRTRLLLLLLLSIPCRGRWGRGVSGMVILSERPVQVLHCKQALMSSMKLELCLGEWLWTVVGRRRLEREVRVERTVGVGVGAVVSG